MGGEITAPALKKRIGEALGGAAMEGGGELALLDLREEGVFGQGHLLFASNCLLSRLELRAADLVPRRAAPRPGAAHQRRLRVLPLVRRR